MRGGTKDRVNLFTALEDLGWFWWLFTTIVGGPSALSIFQIIFVDHRLVDGLQQIVDGYDAVLAVLGTFIEPFAMRIIEQFNRLFDLSLSLHAHWRPQFVLAALSVAAMLRVALPVDGLKALPQSAALAGAALIGALGAGLWPTTAGAVFQGAQAAIPVGAMVFTASVLAAFDRPSEQRGTTLVGAVFVVSGSAFMAFLVAAGLSQLQVFARGAGVATFAALVGLYGALMLSIGLKAQEALMARFGLTVIGGFIVAAIILLADAVLKQAGFAA